MKIDAATGEVTLASGFSFGAKTPLAFFQSREECLDWNDDNSSCTIIAMEIEGRPLKLRAGFNQGLLASCHLDIDLHDHEPPFSAGEFSYELQVRELEIYRQILFQSLGKPKEIRRTSVGGDDYSSLNCYYFWDLSWGYANAGAHPKDEIVSASFRYKTNQKQPLLKVKREQDVSFWKSLARSFGANRNKTRVGL